MTDYVLRKLGANIRRRREELGYTQEGFAHYAQIARTYYGRIERGEQNLSIERLAYVAAHLNASIPELTEGLTPDVCAGRPPPEYTAG